MDNPIQTFVDILPDASSQDLFVALHRLYEDAVGVKLFTCSQFDLEAGKAERIYTSDPVAYPLTGLKDIVPNRWTGIVLDQRMPFLAENIEGLRDVFPDHEKIEALGLGAAINLPTFVGGRMFGSANLLDTDNSYSRETLNTLASLSVCATVAFLVYHAEKTAS